MQAKYLFRVNSYIIKLNEDGSLEWEKSYKDKDKDIHLEDVLMTANNEFILCGFTYATFKERGWLSKFDNNFEKVWENNYDSTIRNILRSICKSNNGYLLCGLKSYELIKTWLLKILPLTENILNRVKLNFEKWKIKDEFEKTRDYKERMGNYYKQINFFFNEALNYYSEYIKINIIGKYDADNETYRISFPFINNAIIKVPIIEAKQFKTNVEKLEIKNCTFSLFEKQWTLSYAEILNPMNNSIYVYNSSYPEYVYNPIEISLDLKFDTSVDYSNINENKDISFKYIRDISGEIKYENITVYGTSYGGENDTPKIVENRAYNNAIRNALEKVNGIYIEGNSIVINGILVEDKISSQIIGVVKLLNKEIVSRQFIQGNYEISCKCSLKNNFTFF